MAEEKPEQSLRSRLLKRIEEANPYFPEEYGSELILNEINMFVSSLINKKYVIYIMDARSINRHVHEFFSQYDMPELKEYLEKTYNGCPNVLYCYSLAYLISNRFDPHLLRSVPNFFHLRLLTMVLTGKSYTDFNPLLSVLIDKNISNKELHPEEKEDDRFRFSLFDRNIIPMIKRMAKEIPMIMEGHTILSLKSYIHTIENEVKGPEDPFIRDIVSRNHMFEAVDLKQPTRYFLMCTGDILKPHTVTIYCDDGGDGITSYNIDDGKLGDEVNDDNLLDVLYSISWQIIESYSSINLFNIHRVLSDLNINPPHPDW